MSKKFIIIMIILLIIWGTVFFLAVRYGENDLSILESVITGRRGSDEHR